jgi:hypothetical protein
VYFDHKYDIVAVNAVSFEPRDKDKFSGEPLSAGQAPFHGHALLTVTFPLDSPKTTIQPVLRPETCVSRPDNLCFESRIKT